MFKEQLKGLSLVKITQAGGRGVCLDYGVLLINIKNFTTLPQIEGRIPLNKFVKIPMPQGWSKDDG